MSLASIKRRITVGTLLKMVRHDWFKGGSMIVHGNLGAVQLKGGLVGVVRPVAIVQAGQIGLTTTRENGTKSISYLQWPKTSSIRETENGFEIDLNGIGTFESIMAYEFVRRCDCESEFCHAKADCFNEGTVKTIHSTVCAACAEKMPVEYLVPEYDFVVCNEGSIFLLQPLSDAGQAWIEEHIPDDAQYFGHAVVVEHRYIEIYCVWNHLRRIEGEMSTASKVAEHKDKHPELYCPHNPCLWCTGGGYCPRHKPKEDRPNAGQTK